MLIVEEIIKNYAFHLNETQIEKLRNEKDGFRCEVMLPGEKEFETDIQKFLDFIKKTPCNSEYTLIINVNELDKCIQIYVTPLINSA